MLWTIDVLWTVEAALLGPLGIVLAVLALAGAGVACVTSGGRVGAAGDGSDGPARQETEE